MKRREFLKLGFQELNVGNDTVESGVAEIDKTKCSAWSGGDCRMCYIRCPLMDKAIVLEDFKPVVVRRNCDGCGICENICAMINGRAFIKVVQKDGLVISRE